MDLEEDPEQKLDCGVGDFVACEIAVSNNTRHRVHVCRIEQILEIGNLVRVTVYEVPRPERHGPWSRRPWGPALLEAGQVRTETIAMSEILCVVELQDMDLTARALELLTAKGITGLDVPTLDKSLPARRA